MIKAIKYLYRALYFSCFAYNAIQALVVKWISQRSSEPSLGVRVPPGAQKDNDLKESSPSGII